MRAKRLLTNILLALALPLAPTGARADSETGAANITIGSTAVFSGTAGLLYGASGLVQSLAASVTNGSNYTSAALGNNIQLSLTTDGTSSNFAATLALINTSTSGGWGNQLEVYDNVGGTYSLNTYINNAGIYYSTLNMVISGHYSSGAGTGGHYGGGFAVLQPNNYYQNMYACWADITGSCYQARNNTGAVGELSFSGQNHNGVFTIGLDAENSQFILGNTTITASGQVFTGDTFIARAAAANIRFGGADAAAPVAQTISFQNVLAGTSNTAGVNMIFQASAGTGNAAGGSFLFQTALPGSSGTAQNAFTTALTVDGANGVTIGNGGSNSKQLTLTPNSGNAVSLGMNNGGGQLLLLASGGNQIGGVWGSGFIVPSSECYAFASSGSTVTSGGAISLCYQSGSVLNVTAGYAGSTSGSLAATSFIAAGAATTASTGQISYGGTTAAASNCGSLSGAAGCIVENIAGATHYTPYY